MSFDLVETEKNLTALSPVSRPTVGAWDNFLSGTASYTMRGFAQAGRAGSLAIGGALSLADKGAEDGPFKGRGLRTYLADSWFKIHDDVFQNAVDHWTPKPGETGAAAEVAGALLSTLPLVIASPAAAVASMQLSTSEDLSRKGVDTGKAVAVGAVQGAGLGLGVWMPILGSSGWQRMVVGGAGFNVSQGVVTRGVSGSILEGTAAAKDFEAFDWSAVTLDALLGLAFGGLSHLSPAQRAQGEQALKRIESVLKGANPSDLDAIAALKQAEHLNVESAPGKLAGPEDIDAHTQRVRRALEQIVQGKPVSVEDLPKPNFKADAERAQEAKVQVEQLRGEAEQVMKAEGMVPPEETITVSRAVEEPAVLAEAAGADPLQAEALRLAQTHPDIPLIVGRDADGTPITKTLKQYLEDVDGMVLQANDDARLFEVAAACMLGAA